MKRRIRFGWMIALLCAAAALAGAVGGRELWIQHKEQAEFEGLEKLFYMERKPATATGAMKEERPGEGALITEDGAEPQAALSADAAATQGHGLERMTARNEDCVGWIRIPGTKVSYPIMHTPLEPEKYLRRNFYGETSQSGVPFLDGRCSLLRTHLLIYGHNLRSGRMFGSLRYYTDVNYWKKHPEIELDTASGHAVYRIFAVLKTDSHDAWYHFLSAKNEVTFRVAVSNIQSRALYDTHITPVYGQQLLTLSTCYGGKEGRLLVIAARS